MDEMDDTYNNIFGWLAALGVFALAAYLIYAVARVIAPLL